ncbi:MAG TPA: metallophosphoesterase [Bacteroidota bacterium]|nr:metallophosphoesterase [Bacteroidota bacterium]
MIIAHLSDLHINGRLYPERSELLRATLRECDRRGVGHIVVTGDLSHLGTEEELNECVDIFRASGYWDAERLTVTIGNHDIYGGPYYAEDVLAFPGRCRETEFAKKVDTFGRIFHPVIGTAIRSERGALFPFVKLVGEIAFVVLNTVAPWSALRNPLGSNGTIDEEQLGRLHQLLNDSRLQGHRLFALTHHHFHRPKYISPCSAMTKLWHRIEGQTLKLYGRKKLLDVFRLHGVEKVLHGHVHEHTEYRAGGVTCLNAGATLQPEAGHARNFHILGAESATVRTHEQDRLLHRFPMPLQPSIQRPRYGYSI